MLSGDVETNPGPIEEVLAELRDFRLASDKHFESLKGDISSLRTEMGDMRRDLETVKEKVRNTTRDIDLIYDECYGDIRSMGFRLERLEKKVENQERYSRRDNLLFYDIPGDRDENHDVTSEKLVKVLNENTSSKTWSNNDFVRIHRLKTKQPGIAPIIARFVRTESKFVALDARKALKDKGHGVANDLSEFQRDELARLKRDGRRGYYKGNRLIIDPGYNPGNAAATRGQPSGNTVSRGEPGRPWRFGENRGGGFPSTHYSDRRRDFPQLERGVRRGVPEQSLFSRNDSQRSDSANEKVSERSHPASS